MKQLFYKSKLVSVITALTLTIALLLSTVAGLSVMANESESINVWTQQKSATAPEGDGTEEKPYLISNGEELAWAIHNKGGDDKFYKLTADIYLNDPSKVNWETGESLDPNNYTPKKWDNFYNAFTGTIDGDGHVIYGLYLTVEKSATPSLNYGVGLIEKSVGYVEIKNLGMDNIYIDTRYNAAAFVGRAGSSSSGSVSFSNCFVGENATITGSSAGSFVGYGGCSAAYNLTIDSCYSLAQPVGKVKNSTDDYSSAPYCGLTGGMWGTAFAIRNSYALGYISHSVNANAEISNNYSAVQNNTDASRIALVSIDDMKGANAATAMPNLGDNFAYTASYPALIVFPHEPLQKSKYWTGDKTPPEGYGTEEKPYLISNGEELAWAINNKGGTNQYFKLTSDIYLNETDKIDWTTGVADSGYAIKNWDTTYNAFTGTIDGDGHVIYGLYLTVEKSATPSLNYGVGLIEKSVGYVEIKNLGMDNIYIDTRYTAAAFVGRAGSTSSGSVSFSNCFVGENATITGSSAGSFVGYGGCSAAYNLTIDSCYSLAQPVGKVNDSNGDYTSAPYCGLTGGMWGTAFAIRNSYALGYISHSVNANAEISNNYSAVQNNTDDSRIALVSIDDMKGANAATAMPNLGDNFAYTASYPALIVFPHEAIELIKYWTGSKTMPKGDGTEKIPYLISNGEELAWAINNKGGTNQYFKLTSDIYLNETDKIDWTTGAADSGYTIKNWGTAYNPFTGTIDGDGHVIYGLYLTVEKSGNPSTGYSVGLIEKSVGYVEIKNLGMDNIYIDTRYTAAAFVGRAGSTSSGSVSFSNCFVGENATITGSAAGSFVSWGDCSQPDEGQPNYLTINSCYSLAQPVGRGSTAEKNFAENTWCGLTGAMWGDYFEIRNSYALGYISHSVNANAEISNNYSAAQGSAGNAQIAYVPEQEMKGINSINAMPGLVDAFMVTSSYPVLKAFNDVFVNAVGAETDGTNIRFIMSYTGKQVDGNTVITLSGEEFKVVARGILVTGTDNLSAKLVAGTASFGVVEIYTEDLSNNWSFDAATGTTEFSANINGLTAGDDYEFSARGYVELENGAVYYTNLLTASVASAS